MPCKRIKSSERKQLEEENDLTKIQQIEVSPAAGEVPIIQMRLTLEDSLENQEESPSKSSTMSKGKLVA